MESKIVGVTVAPLRVVPASEVQEETFTRELYEDVLNKVSRPVRGKYADVPTSSEEFARRKQEEIDLEERR